MQILIITSTLISCYFNFKPSPIDEIKKEWISIPYNKLTDTEVERMIGKPKNIIDIDYEIDDGNTVYFEIIPTKNVDLNKAKITMSPSPLTSVIIKEIPTKYHRC